jgi:hypothetical protein
MSQSSEDFVIYVPYCRVCEQKVYFLSSDFSCSKCKSDLNEEMSENKVSNRSTVETELEIKNFNICSICLEINKIEDKNTKRLECGHYFHKQCVDPWLEKRKTCPLCRVSSTESSKMINSQVPNRRSCLVYCANHLKYRVLMRRESALRRQKSRNNLYISRRIKERKNFCSDPDSFWLSH